MSHCTNSGIKIGRNREKVRKIGKRWRVCPSLPWCLGVAEYWQKTIFNRVSEGTLKRKRLGKRDRDTFFLGIQKGC